MAASSWYWLPVRGAPLDPGVALPFAALGEVVIFQHGKAADQRPGIAIGPQPHVDAEDKTVRGGLVEGADQLLAEQGEVFMVAGFARPGGFAFLGVGKDQVDIR